MTEKILNNLHVESWECSPARKDGGTPARRIASQTARVKDSFGQGTQYFGAESVSSFVKGTTSSNADFNGRSITAQLGLMGIEIPGVAMASFLPQRQMPKTLKKEQIWKLKRKSVCLKHLSISFGSSASQTNPQRSLLIIAPAISTDTRVTWHVISVSANTTSSKRDPGSLPQPLRTLVVLGSPLHKTSMLPQCQSGIIYCC